MALPKRDSWVLVTRRGEALYPFAQYDSEIIGRFPENKPVRAQFAQPRSIDHHRWFFAMLRIVCENTSYFASPENLKETLQMSCGVTRPVVDVEGNITMVPDSIAFMNMDETRFKEFTDAAGELIVTRVMPGADLDELMREAKRRVGWIEKEAA